MSEVKPLSFEAEVTLGVEDALDADAARRGSREKNRERPRPRTSTGARPGLEQLPLKIAT